MERDKLRASLLKQIRGDKGLEKEKSGDEEGRTANGPVEFTGLKNWLPSKVNRKVPNLVSKSGNLWIEELVLFF